THHRTHSTRGIDGYRFAPPILLLDCFASLGMTGLLRPKQQPEENPMLTLHHLNDSRSQRILWLLEELGTPYEMKRYQRNAETRLAPPELAKIHPLGKSPVITDGDTTIAESGAVVDYIIRRYSKGAMMPALGSADYEAYKEW